MHVIIPSPLFEKIISNEKYNLTEKGTIGSGGFGSVYKITIDKDTCKKIVDNNKLIQLHPEKLYAIKKLNENETKYIIREAYNLNSLIHPFIINLTACCFFENSQFYPSFITSYAENGSLASKLNRPKFLTEWSPLEKNKFLYGLCRSVWFLHHLNIFHRDIKSDNILITHDKMPLLSDLGTSKIKFSLENSIIAHTNWYSPPDAFKEDATLLVDVFTLALCLWEFFEIKRIKNFVGDIQKKNYSSIPELFYEDEKVRPSFSNNTPDKWQELIKMMWKTEPLQRLKMDEVIQEICKKEYFLPGVDENDMISFIEEVQKKEHEFSFYTPNNTVKFLINKNETYISKNSKIGKINESIAIFSIALFCIMKLYDYSAAYKILKELEEVDKNKSRALLQFINKESEKSLFIKGMILEGQEKYQAATEIYNDSLDNEGFDVRVYGRLGRLYAIYGTNDELRAEGLQMMDHSSFLGDDFSSFQLGLIYLKRSEESSSSPSNTENLEKSRYYFDCIKKLKKDILEQIYGSFYIESIEDKVCQYIRLIDILSENILEE